VPSSKLCVLCFENWKKCICLLTGAYLVFHLGQSFAGTAYFTTNQAYKLYNTRRTSQLQGGAAVACITHRLSLYSIAK